MNSPNERALWARVEAHLDARTDPFADAELAADLTSAPEVERAARRLVARLEPHTLGRLVEAVPAPTGAGLLALLGDDEASRAVRTLDADAAAAVLAALPHARSALLRGLLAWPQESAASWMRPAYLRVGERATIALDHTRRRRRHAPWAEVSSHSAMARRGAGPEMLAGRVTSIPAAPGRLLALHSEVHRRVTVGGAELRRRGGG